MRLGHIILNQTVTTSTMDDAERLAVAGAEEGLIVVADEQTAGRGRAGRNWHAPPGTALLCSVLLRPPLPPDRLSTLPLIAGVAVAEAIEDCAPVTCRLKWPNDIWIEEKKIAGILMKATTSGERTERVILGIGINLSTGPEDLPQAATSISGACGVTVPRAHLLESLITRLQFRYDRFLGDEGRPDLNVWLNRTVYLDEVVAIEDDGNAVVGRMCGVDGDGALLLDVDGMLRRIVAGDLSRGPVPLTPHARLDE
ncbi:MAG TPA: biotin--[acetyl-CoA-carboxylase] ligase [Thermomicrobiales bacterium]|nr:biotin--[acetyl-CoA-carboxylase] ligase [Thermomicrobiales bacterium]